MERTKKRSGEMSGGMKGARGGKVIKGIYEEVKETRGRNQSLGRRGDREASRKDHEKEGRSIKKWMRYRRKMLKKKN